MRFTVKSGRWSEGWRTLYHWSLLVSLVLAGCVGKPPAGPKPPWHIATLGLCEDYPEEVRSISAARTDLALAAASGAKVLRIAVGWDAIEPERGGFDWQFWDDFVRAAVDDHGLRLIPYVCYTPKWAATDQGENFWRSPPRDPEDFGRFMRAIVERYKNRIASWELWNEPDNQSYWLGTPKQFAALVRAGSEAVRRSDPGAVVVLGGIATKLEFLEELFERERIAPAVDVVNLHSYFETWHPDAIESLPSYVARADEIVREFGEREPLWMAETGYSSVGERAAVSDVYRARHRGEHTALAQASALMRTALLALATTRVPVFAWYRINDLPATESVIGDDNNRHLGVRTARGETKPALAAFTLLNRLFDQPYRVATPDVQVQSGTAAAHVRHFIFQDGRQLVASWLGTSAAVAASDSTASLPADPRKATIRVGLSAVGSSLRTVDAVGQPVARSRASARDRGKATELSVNLVGGEVFLSVFEPQ